MFAKAPAPPELPLERLEHEIVQLAAHVNAGLCRWLELVAEFDRREGWASWGCRSAAEWVAWRCALEPRTAREHVRVARALRAPDKGTGGHLPAANFPGKLSNRRDTRIARTPVRPAQAMRAIHASLGFRSASAHQPLSLSGALSTLPAIQAAFASGRLSYAKVRALTRIATADRQDELLELAEHATASQLERIVRGLRRVSCADAAAAQQSRHLSAWWEDDGSLSIRANLPAEERRGRGCCAA